MEAIIWNVDPEIFALGPFSVRYYGLLFALAFVFGYIIMKRYFAMDKLPIERLDMLTTYVFIGTLVGARLGHCFFYEPDFYLQNPVEILKVWHGGLASHGAAIGIILALYFYSRKTKIPLLKILDRVVIVVALGGFFIRMGNFFNSEIYGYNTSMPWGVIFAQKGETVPKHPTQIYEALIALIIFFSLHKFFIKYYKRFPDGLVFGMFLVSLFTMRFLIEYIKEPQVPFETEMSLNMGQWLSLPFIIFGLGLIIFLFYKKSYLIRTENSDQNRNKL
ncbi:MAG TPA: prolipoprotein diacylglyceryl transferase [Salinivirgaceae bacterium]|nr:prolipoprotein diacylglyceryl transferase [Salinivirgaceae bacterium]